MKQLINDVYAEDMKILVTYVFHLASAPNISSTSSVLMYPYGSSIGDVPIAFDNCDYGDTPSIKLLPEFRFIDKIRKEIYVSYLQYLLLVNALPACKCSEIKVRSI
jgi:hypothetical protein